MLTARLLGRGVLYAGAGTDDGRTAEIAAHAAQGDGAALGSAGICATRIGTYGERTKTEWIKKLASHRAVTIMARLGLSLR